MKTNLYTVEQVATLLDLHPKTIRRFIYEGKLPAQKVGGQWRVTESDLQTLTGRLNVLPSKNEPWEYPKESLNVPKGNKVTKIQVSTIVDIWVTDKEEAFRISSTIMAVMNCKDQAYGNARCDYVFNEEEMKARFILWGSPAFISDLLACFQAIAGECNGVKFEERKIF